MAGRLRDALEVLRHARGPGELARALLPPALQRPVVLNEGRAGATGDVTARLAALRRRLAAEAISDRGVDYRRLAGSPVYAELQQTARALAGHPGVRRRGEAPWPDGEAARAAFWINLYNVLTIHGIVALGIRRSVAEVPSFFARVAYRVGPHVLTLDDVEHGVLRGNAAHPISGRIPFGPADPRAALAAAAVDPRIHAALVCGARGCPPIALYDADRLDAQLDAACASLVGAVEVDDAARVIRLPRILDWYAVDFGGADGVRAFVRRHLEPDRRAAFDAAIAAGYRDDHLRYDWALNQPAQPGQPE